MIVTHLVKKFPSILWNNKVHYCVQNSLLLVPVLSQANPVHNLTIHFFKLSFNIILPSMLRSPKWSPYDFRLKFYIQSFISPCKLCPSYFILLYFTNLTFSELNQTDIVHYTMRSLSLLEKIPLLLRLSAYPYWPNVCQPAAYHKIFP